MYIVLQIKQLTNLFPICFHLQIISLESIMELGRARERRKIQDEMRALALNVFLQGRRLLNHNSTVKSLTGFGTAAAADIFLKSKDVRCIFVFCIKLIP